jgi:S1-C subfamily serine protease
MGLAGSGPAEQAGVQVGDLVLAVAGKAVGNLASFFRRVWALGDAGVEVPLTVHREGGTFDIRIASGDRNRFLKAPRLH